MASLSQVTNVKRGILPFIIPNLGILRTSGVQATSLSIIANGKLNSPKKYQCLKGILSGGHCVVASTVAFRDAHDEHIQVCLHSGDGTPGRMCRTTSS